MTVMVEIADDGVDAREFQRDLGFRFHAAPAVKLVVKVATRGEPDQYTGVTQLTKAQRLLDKCKVY